MQKEGKQKMVRFSRVRKKRKDGILMPILLFAAFMLLFYIAILSVSSGTTKRQMEALENAVTRYITECYAEEGFYPEDIYYLEEHYGLRYNSDRFYVDYRISGANIRPEFTVVERSEAD